MSEGRCTVHVAPQLVDFVRSQPPETRRRLRLALRALARGQGDIKALEGALTGYHRLRVGASRVIVRFGTRPGGHPAVYCIFAERRSLVYLLLEDFLHRGLVEAPPTASR